MDLITSIINALKKLGIDTALKQIGVDIKGLNVKIGSKADLVDGKIPATQLPSYVDDVSEFANLAAFPATGESGKIYIAINNPADPKTTVQYRWSGSLYVPITSSPGSSDAVPEGTTNKYFTTQRASAAAPVQSVAGKSGDVTLVKSDVGLSNVDNTSDANKPVSAAVAAALANKQASLPAGTDGQFLAADKTFKPITAATVGLPNVPNVDATNPASVVQSSNFRFTTDTEKAIWNAVAIPEVYKGGWNVATNTPDAAATLTASGDTFDILVGGTSSITGTSETYVVGDRLKKTPTGFIRLPLATRVPDQSLSENKLTPALAAKLPSTDYNGGYPYAVIDQNGKVSFYVDLAGRLSTPQIGDVSAAVQAVQSATPVVWPDESGYVWGVTDSAGKIAIGLDKGGNLILKGQALSTLINALVSSGLATSNAAIQASIDQLNSYNLSWPDQSGYVWGVMDAAGKIAFGLDRAGNLIYKGVSIAALLNGDVQTQVNALSPFITPNKNIQCIGDSLTAANYPTILSGLFTDGRSVTNGGVGGDTSTQIAFRHGSISVAAQVTGLQLPASGSVALTPANLNILQNGRSVTATIANISGTFARDSSGNYTFTRTTAGDVVILDKTVMVNPVTSTWDTNIAVIWMGRNNYTDTATVLADIAATVATLKSVRKRFIVMSVLNGNYGSTGTGEYMGGNTYNTMMSLNATLRATYPRNFIDIRELIVRNYNPAIAQDLTDHDNDITPSSLRVDNVHLTVAGYQLVAQAVYNFITQRGW
ncbi:hypothetical protein [Fibrella forsythiae]|uniref:SGNH hydrolase-type esterase domain-containing protein n=1 Tax=Fibrella forsythiae TaxID=2817061 RepID=A0ABS3JMH2_9BACT|nr:hypothetical protein [Fibrella forsythiae]MBO0951217.1 hypothetical protein [Fibrella forsythiae]